MKHPFRIFGSVIGLSPKAFQNIQDRFASFEEVKHSNRTLTVDHEGSWFDVEGIAKELADTLDSDGEGHIDVVDNHDWVLTRYLITPGKVAIKIINLNDATDKYIYE